MARVNLETQIWADTRFKILGLKAGIDFFSAIGRCAAVWSYCTERSKYDLSQEEIDMAADLSGFAQALIDSELGTRLENDQIRVHGTQGRVEWLENKRRGAEKARKSKKQTGKVDSNLDINPDINLDINPDSNLDINLDIQSRSKSRSRSQSKYRSEEKRDSSESPMILFDLWTALAKNCPQPSWKSPTQIPYDIQQTMMEAWNSLPSRDYWEDVIRKCDSGSIDDWKPDFLWIISKAKDGMMNHSKVSGGRLNQKEKHGNDRSWGQQYKEL